MTSPTWEALRGLELTIAELRTERRAVEVSSDFTRVTTTVVLTGNGHEGRGEDVTYDAAAHDAFPSPELFGSHTLETLSAALESIEMFPAGEPKFGGTAEYRRWAFESAALDLALRQAGTALGEALGREYRPVRFVVSTRGDAFAWLAAQPTLEFKLDPTSEWSREFMEGLAATGRVRCLDFKAYYVGTPVDQPPDPELYRACVEIFPDAVIEGAAFVDGTREVLASAEERLSFDAPVHSLADVDSLPVSVRWLNIKPSRFGSVAALFECVNTCAERGIRMYGGGQFELGCGRGQIQALASLFYPDTPNDVAPGAYNESDPRPGLPASPLQPPARPTGFSFT